MMALATAVSRGHLRRVGRPATTPIAPGGGYSLESSHCILRLFGYSAFDSIRKPSRRRAASSYASFDPIKTRSVRRSGDSDSDAVGSPTSMQSSSNRREEPMWEFPETLSSGRYKQKKGGGSRRRYSDAASSSSSYESAPDKRFFRRLQDYREVEDDDPYAGVFGERLSVKRRRVREWQRQFEEENAHVELPYERTNVIARLAPNWFVRYFLNIRDRGGADSMGYLIVCGLALVVMLWLVRYLFYTPPSQARPMAEMR